MYVARVYGCLRLYQKVFIIVPAQIKKQGNYLVYAQILAIKNIFLLSRQIFLKIDFKEHIGRRLKARSKIKTITKPNEM